MAVAALEEEGAVARAAHLVEAAGDNAVEVDRQALASGPKPATKTPLKAANTEPLRERRSSRVERVDYAKMCKADDQENSSQEEQNSQNS